MYGFWLKGNKIIDITDTKHILYIIQNPEVFGLTTEYIKNVYDKHNEKLGIEDNAREELIRLVAEKCWIRIRHYNKKENEYWSIQFDKFDLQNKKAIKYFVKWALNESKIMNKNDSLVLTGYKDNFHFEYNFMNRGVNKFLIDNRD